MTASPTLLLVDDDEVDRLAVQRALRSAEPPFTIVERHDAASAITYLASSEVDCILLDLHMPGKTGLELLRELRAGGDDVPVVMLTGQGDEETAVAIMKSGASDYVNKASMSAERLQKSVGQALRVHRAEEDARKAQVVLQRYAEQLRLLADAATDVNAQLSLDTLMKTIADRAREIVGAHVAVVRTISASADTPETRAVSLSPRHAGAHGSVPPLGAAALDVQPLQRCVRMTDAELRDDPELSALARATGLHLPLRGWLAAPITSRDGKRIGVVHLSDKIDGEFATTDESILVQLAQLASVAIGNAGLFAAERAATRQRDDMVALVSHDLRNPLNTIVMGSAFLLDPSAEIGEANTTTVLRIQRAASRMNRLISDLLDMTRIQSGLLTVTPSVLAIDDLVEDALDPFRPLAADKNVRLVKHVHPDAARAHADRDRVLQVVENLLGNALKFTPEGGTITLGAETSDDGVRMFVSDTGVGILPADIPNLFDRHWQAHETSKYGSGLGLFIAKGIVDAHGGRIWAESKQAEGSTFSFTLRAV